MSLLNYRFPRHQAETNTVAEHRKAPACELHVAAIGSGHALAIDHGVVRKTSLRCDGFGILNANGGGVLANRLSVLSWMALLQVGGYRMLG